jgi:hypothetical protein
MRLCEQRFGVHIDHLFCPSHKGEPGNELVDKLAYGAASGKPLQDWISFLQEMQNVRFIRAMEWAWMLFANLPGVDVENDKSVFPAKPLTTPTAKVMPPLAVMQSEEVHVHVSIKIATCNVLTLQMGGRSQTGRGCRPITPRMDSQHACGT